MKIALCLEYPIDQHGGVEVVVSELIKGLAARHQLWLVSRDPENTLKKSTVHSLLAGHFPWDPATASAEQSQKLAAALQKAGVELAHFHFGGHYGWGNRFPFRCPIYFLDRLGIPCVSTIHSAVGLTEGYCGPQRTPWFKWLMLPLAWAGKMQQLSCTRAEVAVSKQNLRRLREWYWPLRNRLMQIYHSRLHDAAVPPSAVRERVILNAGHVARVKGQRVLVEAFARIAARYPGWVLQLAGYHAEDDYVRQIQELVRQRQLEQRVLVLGERTDVGELMDRASIYVQPSRQEALGLGLQEAMFRGCACVGSRVGGIPELIREDEDGLLFEPGDDRKLAEILEGLINDEERRERLGRAAARSVRERGMTAEKMTENYLRLYESIRA